MKIGLYVCIFVSLFCFAVFSESVTLKQPGVKYTDTLKQKRAEKSAKDGGTPSKQPGVKYSDTLKQLRANQSKGVVTKQPGISYRDTLSGFGRSENNTFNKSQSNFLNQEGKNENNNQNDNSYEPWVIDDHEINKQLGIVKNVIDEKELTPSTQIEKNLSEFFDEKPFSINDAIVDTTIGCNKESSASSSCESIEKIYLGLKKENREKLSEIQIMLRLIDYELESSNKDKKSETNIRGIFDQNTWLQMYSYLKSNGISTNNLEKLNSKLKKKETKILATNIINKLLPILQKDLKDNGITDCTYLLSKRNLSDFLYCDKLNY